jgi:hypothetical protein
MWEWLADLDWGNVPAWTGSILTSGSLLLGFRVLRHGQLRDEREQAAKVAVVLGLDTEFLPYYALTVDVWNHSQASIQLPCLVDPLNPNRLFFTLPEGVDDPEKWNALLQPGEHGVVKISSTAAPQLAERAYISFTDAAGLPWRRYLLDQGDRLERVRFSKRKLRRKKKKAVEAGASTFPPSSNSGAS